MPRDRARREPNTAAALVLLHGKYVVGKRSTVAASSAQTEIIIAFHQGSTDGRTSPVGPSERIRAVAESTHRPFEEVLVDWIHRGGAEPDVAARSDDELLNRCDQEMAAETQDELSELLERNREGLLETADRARLDELMRSYRRGLVRKAQALQAAVARGLRPQLS